MVLYFTGTGNSRHIAERIAHALNDTLISLNDRIKSGDITSLAVNGRLVLVMPTYAWRIPRIVRDHLLRTELRGARETWFVMDCGSEIGNAAKYNRALCREKGLVYMGTAQIVMPENFIAMFNAPTVEEARRIVAKAEPFIDRAIAAIRAGHMFSPPRKKLYDRIASSAVNPVFYPLFVKANPFTASDVCIGCGKCEKLCPLNNITLQNARPVWGTNCTQCMACICYCPTRAIEYGKKSVGKPRYHFEELYNSFTLQRFSKQSASLTKVFLFRHGLPIWAKTSCFLKNVIPLPRISISGDTSQNLSKAARLRARGF